MNVQDVGSEVSRVLAGKFGVSLGKVCPTTTLAELGADDFDTVELTIELEEEFEVEISDEEALDNLQLETTVQQVCEFVTAKLDAKD